MICSGSVRNPKEEDKAIRHIEGIKKKVLLYVHKNHQMLSRVALYLLYLVTKKKTTKTTIKAAALNRPGNGAQVCRFFPLS